jgi:hypothetical protein
MDIRIRIGYRTDTNTNMNIFWILNKNIIYYWKFCILSFLIESLIIKIKYRYESDNFYYFSDQITQIKSNIIWSANTPTKPIAADKLSLIHVCLDLIWIPNQHVMIWGLRRIQAVQVIKVKFSLSLAITEKMTGIRTMLSRAIID